MSEENNDYYVYVHRRKDNGVVFYVGHGRLKRGDNGSRTKTKDWSKVESIAGGHIIEKLKENLTKHEANKMEHDYLVNPPDDWQLVNKRLPVKSYELDYDYLNTRFEYSEESKTSLKWKGAKIPAYNGRDAGGIQGTGQGNKTYYAVRDGKKLYLIHRIVWILHNKKDILTGMVVDHIDGNSLNNRISNLRVVTPQQNASNKGKQLSESGITGVRREEKEYGCYWSAYISSKGVKHSKCFSITNLGEDEAKQQAINKRIEFEKLFKL
jgi:hypothetical protein